MVILDWYFIFTFSYLVRGLRLELFDELLFDFFFSLSSFFCCLVCHAHSHRYPYFHTIGISCQLDAWEKSNPSSLNASCISCIGYVSTSNEDNEKSKSSSIDFTHSVLAWYIEYLVNHVSFNKLSQNLSDSIDTLQSSSFIILRIQLLYFLHIVKSLISSVAAQHNIIIHIIRAMDHNHLAVHLVCKSLFHFCII